VIVASCFERYKKALQDRPQAENNVSAVEGESAPLPTRHE
jgi:hypothetical protein